MALASIAQSSVGRQEESTDLYKQFLADFDGQTQCLGQNVEQEFRRRAEMQLTAMKFSPIGRSAPEIVGVDLSGHPMTLSEYRGKVVLLSFWATWCGPCMKLNRRRDELQQYDYPQRMLRSRALTKKPAGERRRASPVESSPRR